MAGATLQLEFGFKGALEAINKTIQVINNPKALYADIGEFLLITHTQRFSQQVSPTGSPWKALSPKYLRQKKRNKDKILQLDGYLKNTLRYLVDAAGVLFGSDRVYAAIQHFGGEIKREARESEVFFKQGRDGNVGNRFVKRKQSNFAQRVKIGAYVIHIPARPWLGTSTSDDNEILAITQRHLERALGT